MGYIDKGNTEYIAEFVQELTGADMFKVEPAVPYAADYNTCIEEAKKRVGNAPIKEKLTDISAYDTIYVRGRDMDRREKAVELKHNGYNCVMDQGYRNEGEWFLLRLRI